MNVIVWSKPNCPWCSKAKELLDAYYISYEERKLGEEWSKEDLLEMVPNAKTVPQILVDNNLIGGYNELERYLNTSQN